MCYLLQEILGSGTLDWEKAEEIISQFPELKKYFIEEVREDLAMGSSNIDPVGKIYNLIRDFSEFSQYFEVYPNCLCTDVSVDVDSLFDRMYEENLDWDVLDSYTKFLLEEAGISPDDWDKYYEERKMYDEV